MDINIYFALVVPDWRPEQATPTQGFSLQLCLNSDLFRAASLLPVDIVELTPDGRDTFVPRRVSGAFPVRVYPQSPRAVRAMPMPATMPFSVVFLPDGEALADYDDWLRLCESKPIVISRDGGDLRPEDLSLDALRQLFLQRLSVLPPKVPSADVETAAKYIGDWQPMPPRSVPYKVGGHNSVVPNVLALLAAGFQDLVEGPLTDIDNGIGPYVAQIVRTANTILDEREAIGPREASRIFRPMPDVNLFAPSIYPDFFTQRFEQTLAPAERKTFVATKMALRNQTGYNLQVSGAEMRALLNPSGSSGAPTPNPLLALRASEMKLSTNVVGALASSEFSSVLRLPNDVNLLGGAIESFATDVGDPGSSETSRVNAFKRVQSEMARAVPSELIEVLDRSRDGVRVIADAPLEWLNLDGLPLMIRKVTSRIPVTPGNLFVTAVGPSELLHLAPRDLRKILILDAVSEDDPIHGIFDIALSGFAKVWQEKIETIRIPVGSADDIVRALNDFDGNVVVFDGHGGHANGEPGKLYLRGSGVDVWGLRERIERIPPIMILSACDTHAIGRNHATTASGFLALGVRAVLGSVLPIGAMDAAIFASRLLYRIADFVEPALRMFGRGLQWSEIVTGLLRMQLMTDFLRRLQGTGALDETAYKDLHTKGNMLINGLSDAPFEDVIDALASTGIERAVLHAELELAVGNSDILAYVHMGRPETILINDRTDSAN